MNDRTDKLSTLMDGELRDQHEQDKCVEKLAQDKEMQDVWQRYHLARDALKGQLSDFPTLDISAAVSESLKSEAVILTPIWRRLSPRYVMKQAAGLAVAAAVGTIAVLSVQQTQLATPDTNAVAQTVNQQSNSQLVATAGQTTGQIRQVSFTTRQKLDSAVESKLSGYLVNHNEFSNSVRVSGVMPYTRIVSFVPASTASSSAQVNNDK
ncbi:MAG: sigma-E factor negative regulatory protein [Gammaproteobacteria bacterium]|nr:sigma-E factor negative regulatory protein [Gammaproteobacteria bacterium]MCW8987542.1 sigma-E factor negative regulatory protein [Gammaproteobacteria bacterium]MCW9029876.1 sigma-E factor negative regulatory protein [Gammaproteobacteria bacterium]